MKALLTKVSFPPEYYADIGGQYEDMLQSNRDFWKALALTIFLVFMVIVVDLVYGLVDPRISVAGGTP